MAVTINDIAAKANVSVSTVSRVLNNQAKKYRISKGTEQVILQAAKELNYRPNHIARGSRKPKPSVSSFLIFPILFLLM